MVLLAVLRDPARLHGRLPWAVPAKLWGVLAMFGSILVWFFLPWLDKSPVRSGHYRPLFRKFFWFGLIPTMAALFSAAARRRKSPT
jgi:ubiquinol-cytochrome c reductase cytochrome b subunit